MKAIIGEQYGMDSLKIQEVKQPAPGANEVLIKIHAAALNAYDWRLITGQPFVVRFMFGLTKPKNSIPGADVAGRVEAVGNAVTQFKAGDEVYGDISDAGCGAFAEYVAVPESAIALKPSNMSFEEAAAVPFAAMTALQGLRDKAKVQPGQIVAINGASGGVGTFAVQIAKSFGAEVTAICSTRNIDTMRSLGADYVIDYKKENFTKSGKQYDLIFAANGDQSILDYKRALAPSGEYLMAGGSGRQMFQSAALGPWISMGTAKKIGAFTMHPTQSDLNALRELIESGKITSVIDRRYPFAEGIDAIRYLYEGHAKGKVVISMEEQS